MITLPCKNVIIVKSNYCSWPAWPWRQRHYNPSKCWELLGQQHSITILRTGIYYIWDSCWLRISRSHVQDATVCSVRGADVLRGRKNLHLHGQPWLHTITPQHTVTHAIPTIVPVLLNVCFMSACKVITLLHGFTWFCTKCWDTFIINTWPCIFFSPL